MLKIGWKALLHLIDCPQYGLPWSQRRYFVKERKSSSPAHQLWP